MSDLLKQFHDCENRCSHLDSEVIKKYFPDGGFEDARKNFFKVREDDVQEFYKLQYPFIGRVVFDRKVFTRLVRVVPEFVISIIKTGMPTIITLGELEVYEDNEPIILSYQHLTPASEIIVESANLFNSIVVDDKHRSEAKVNRLNRKLKLLIISKPHYDLLGIMQSIFTSIVLASNGANMLEPGTQHLYFHNNSKKRDLLFTLIGPILNPLRVVNLLPADTSKEEVQFQIMEDIQKNGPLQLNPSPQSKGRDLGAKHPTNSNFDELEYDCFQNKGDYWLISYRGTSAHLQNLRGFHYLKHLLEHGGESFRSDTLKNIAGFASEAEIRGGKVNVGDNSNSPYTAQLKEPLTSYKRGIIEDGLREMEEELSELHPNSDEHDDLQERILKYKKIMSSGYNHHDSERKAKDPGDAARTSIKKAINRAYNRIDAEIPGLGAFLRRNIDTGIECQYTPPPDNPPDWRF